LALRAIELFARTRFVVVGMEGEVMNDQRISLSVMNDQRISLSVLIALTVGGVYHFAALVLLATSLA
jgi:hypothetical protein